ncbi:MAG: hypothetical protein HQL17_00580 [Candidatus Omnitrophica bacterium]|nr:hypothetical protein [Candidatus Omnitrophota bacterium]
MKKILFLIIAGALCWYFFAPQPSARWSGPLAPMDPVQSADDLPPAWTTGKNTFTPRARYQIKAVVLSKHYYWAGYTEDMIAPYDLALGWGVMSDAAVINALKISQYGRWYNYSWNGSLPVDVSEISAHSANNHIVAATPDILRQIAAIKRFDVVSLRGYLIDISQPDGWRWRTSLTRHDAAGGSCELFWVESVEIVPQP